MKRSLITLLAGTLIFFLWNSFSWLVLPFHGNTLQPIPEQVIQTGDVQQQLTEDGVYHYPGYPPNNTPEAMAQLEEKLKNGPRITLMVYKRGETGFFDPGSFALFLFCNFLAVVLIYYITRGLADRSLTNLLMMTLSIGLVVGLMSDWSQMNWYLFPLDYTLTNVFDHVISAGLFGLFLGTYTYKNDKHD